MGAARAMPYRREKTMTMKVILRSFQIVLFCVLIDRFNDDLVGAGAQATYQETCTNGEPSCTTRVAHIATGVQTVDDLAKLYTVDIADILGANDIDLTEKNLLTARFPESSIVLIPLACDCINSTRRTNSTIYTVQPNDYLSLIATSDDLYQQLTTYQEIGAANGLADVNNIQVGQNLTIPFPCACRNNTNRGKPAVFVTTVVQPGSDLSSIASTFGANGADIIFINGIVNVSNIDAYDRLAVPLQACQSTFQSEALDYGLLVTSDTYSLSPGSGCIQSRCYGSPSLALYSTPAPVTLDANASCPSSLFECSNNQTLGKSTISKTVSNCSVTTCVYEGYANATTIFTTLVTSSESTCPVISPAPPEREVDEALGPIPGVPAPTTGGPTGTAPSPNGAISTRDVHVLLRSLAGIVLSAVIVFGRL